MPNKSIFEESVMESVLQRGGKLKFGEHWDDLNNDGDGMQVTAKSEHDDSDGEDTESDSENVMGVEGILF